MQGLMTIFHKELADNFTSWRGIILFVMVLLAGILVVIIPSGALEAMRAEITEPGQFVFLRIFTTSAQASPTFLWFFAMIIIPIVGIVLGLDAINGEKNRGTLSRLLSQPIYRDAVINGKFLAGVVTLAIMLTTTMLVVSGIGMAQLGIAPNSEEVARLLSFWGMSILYGAFWLGLAMLFSVYCERVATSTLTSIAIWVFFFFYTLTGVAATRVESPQAAITAMRISPLFLFQEAMSVIIIPGARTVTEYLQLSAAGTSFIPGPLSLSQSLLTVWPHMATIGGITVAFFAISYVKFMREEIRAT